MIEKLRKIRENKGEDDDQRREKERADMISEEESIKCAENF